MGTELVRAEQGGRITDVELGEDTVRPFWLQRQVDPAAVAFLPGGGGTPPRNRTHRDWVLLGTLGAPERALVDPRGLITPWEGAWSLDWWIGGEDRWYFPSREITVRQRLVDDAPVVETAVRVQRGDVVQRCFAVAGTGSAPWLIVEIENQTAAAVAIALALRPWNPLGPAPLASVGIEGNVVLADGAAALHLDRSPAHVLLATADDVDLASLLVGSMDELTSPEVTTEPVTCSAGRASAVVVLPLPHTLSLRVALPLTPPERSLRPRRAQASEPPSPAPDSARVAAGWAAQGQRGPRLEIPDEHLMALVRANRSHLLLAHGGEDVLTVPTAAVDYPDTASVLAAASGSGFDGEVVAVLATLEERQGFDGHLLGDDDRRDAVGAALVALGEHWRITRDDALVEELVGPIAKAAHWIGKRAQSRRHRRDPDTLGLLPDGTQPSWLGGSMVSYHDAWWSQRGLLDAAAMLGAVGQPEAADDAARFAAELDGALVRSLAADSERLSTSVVPAGPSRAIDGGIVAIVDAVLLGVLDPGSTAVQATLDAVRERYVVDGAVHQAVGAAGLSARLTARLGRAELACGHAGALDRLAWLERTATPVATWPEVTHPRTGGGAVGAGHDAVAAAEFVLFVRDLLVRWHLDALELVPVLPPSWLGQSWEVHDLPTPFGRFGYAVRWHGERPAVLWELEPHLGVAEPVLRAPGLDPQWEARGWSGEALLAPVSSPAPDDTPAPSTPPDSGGAQAAGGSFA